MLVGRKRGWKAAGVTGVDCTHTLNNFTEKRVETAVQRLLEMDD